MMRGVEFCIRKTIDALFFITLINLPHLTLQQAGNWPRPNNLQLFLPLDGPAGLADIARKNSIDWKTGIVQTTIPGPFNLSNSSYTVGPGNRICRFLLKQSATSFTISQFVYYSTKGPTSERALILVWQYRRSYIQVSFLPPNLLAVSYKNVVLAKYPIITLDKWLLIAVTYDLPFKQLSVYYGDGDPNTIKTRSTSAVIMGGLYPSAGSEINVGHSNTGNLNDKGLPASDAMSCFMYYDTVLNYFEVSQLYTVCKSEGQDQLKDPPVPQPSNLAGFWPFDALSKDNNVANMRPPAQVDRPRLAKDLGPYGICNTSYSVTTNNAWIARYSGYPIGPNFTISLYLAMQETAESGLFMFSSAGTPKLWLHYLPPNFVELRGNNSTNKFLPVKVPLEKTPGSFAFVALAYDSTTGLLDAYGGDSGNKLLTSKRVEIGQTDGTTDVYFGYDGIGMQTGDAIACVTFYSTRLSACEIADLPRVCREKGAGNFSTSSCPDVALSTSTTSPKITAGKAAAVTMTAPTSESTTGGTVSIPVPGSSVSGIFVHTKTNKQESMTRVESSSFSPATKNVLSTTSMAENLVSTLEDCPANEAERITTSDDSCMSTTADTSDSVLECFAGLLTNRIDRALSCHPPLADKYNPAYSEITVSDAVANCPDLSPFNRSPPPYEGTPMPIKMLFSVDRFADLNDVKQTVTVTGQLYLRWTVLTCYRLSKEWLRSERILVPDTDEIWHPAIGFRNSVEDISLKNGQFFNQMQFFVLQTTPKQRIYFYWKKRGIFSAVCKLDLSRFPFDTQQCGFQFNLLESLELAKFAGIGALVPTVSTSTDQQWTFTGSRIEQENVTIDLDDSVSQATFYVSLKRHPDYYLFNLLGPCYILTFLSFVSFLIPPKVSDRVCFNVYMVLALAVTLAQVVNIVPKTPQPILLQAYIQLLSIDCIYCTIHAIVMLWFTTTFEHKAAKKMCRNVTLAALLDLCGFLVAVAIFTASTAYAMKKIYFS